MAQDTWTKADTDKARQYWEAYQQQHDLSERQGQTAGIDPVSGRISALAAHPYDPNIIYIAAAGGGVWETTDAGTTWTPLTDSESTPSGSVISLRTTSLFPTTIPVFSRRWNPGLSTARL